MTTEMANVYGKTKRQMISEIINATNWTPSSKEKNIKYAERKRGMDFINMIYGDFLLDKSHSLFYANCLIA